MAAGFSCLPRVRSSERLSRYSSIRIGGPVSRVVSVTSRSDVEEVFSWLARGLVPGPIFFVGRGSNILFPDKGLEGTLVRFESGVSGSASRWNDDTEVFVEAGFPLPALAREATRRGVAGFEFLAGIPGTVGGAAVMNAGAGGKDWAGICKSVTVMTPLGEVRTLSEGQMGYGYRRSILTSSGSGQGPKGGAADLPAGTVVLSAVLRGTAGSPDHCQELLFRHLEYRRRTQPLEDPSLGSVFRNPADAPDGYTAGRLIEETGLKGEARGGVMVSPRHANFFINTGPGRAVEFLELLDHVISRVKERWQIALEPEVRVWNA